MPCRRSAVRNRIPIPHSGRESGPAFGNERPVPPGAGLSLLEVVASG